MVRPACCPAWASARRTALLPAPLPAVLIPWETAVWDAWAGARPDAVADDWWARPVAGAGKSAVLAPDVLVPDASVAPVGVPAAPAGAAGRKGALYTGRGPVCGTIIRGGGAAGCTGALGAAGLEAMAGGCAGGGAGRGGRPTTPGCWPKLAGLRGGTDGRGATGGAGAAD